MKSLTLALFLSVTALARLGYGQAISQDKGTFDGKTFSYYYLEPNDTVRGIVILLPGWGEHPQSIFDQTSLPHLLAKKGFVSVAPQLQQRLFADDQTVAEINALVAILLKRYHSDHLPYCIGGLSAGGATAVGFAEHELAGVNGSALKGVFAIDPALDLSRMYRSAENKMQYRCQNQLIRKEGKFTKQYLLRILRGSPEERPDAYLAYSAFSPMHPDGGNAKWLQSIPIRLYSEPDLEFVQRTYCAQLQDEDLNAFDLERLHAFLISIGNDRAEYLTTESRGFHSWNIPDPADLAEWIATIMREN